MFGVTSVTEEVGRATQAASLLIGEPLGSLGMLLAEQGDVAPVA